MPLFAFLTIFRSASPRDMAPNQCWARIRCLTKLQQSVKELEIKSKLCGCVCICVRACQCARPACTCALRMCTGLKQMSSHPWLGFQGGIGYMASEAVVVLLDCMWSTLDYDVEFYGVVSLFYTVMFVMACHLFAAA